MKRSLKKTVDPRPKWKKSDWVCLFVLRGGCLLFFQVHRISLYCLFWLGIKFYICSKIKATVQSFVSGLRTRFWNEQIETLNLLSFLKIQEESLNSARAAQWPQLYSKCTFRRGLQSPRSELGALVISSLFLSHYFYLYTGKTKISRFWPCVN